MTSDSRAPDEEIRAVFEEPVMPLNPRPGTWQRIEREAARRRRARRLVAAGSAAVVAAVVGAGTLLVAGPAGDGRLAPTPPGPPATAPADVPIPLPRGGAVPPGFTAVSASTAPGGYLYVLGTAPCPDAPCSSLLRSDDDGATWVQIPAPEAEVVTDAFTPGSRGDLNGQRVDTIRDVRFATPRDGWAFGGALWETHDGGATWTKARGAPGQVLDVVVDGDRILVAATDCQQEDCDSSLEVRSAGVRGGELRADPGRVWPGVDRARFTSGSGTVLLLVGATDTVVYAMDDGRPVEITQPCASVPGRGLADVTPAASGPAGLVAWCAEGEGPASGNLYATTRRSTDGGRSWTTTGEDLHATNGVVSATAATLDRLVFTSGDFMYGGPVQVSRNGGGDWSRSRGPSPRSGWRWVAATGADRVLALPLDPGMLYESTDGGASFTARPFG